MFPYSAPRWQSFAGALPNGPLRHARCSRRCSFLPAPIRCAPSKDLRGIHTHGARLDQLPRGRILAAFSLRCANAKSIAARTAVTCAALHCSGVARGLFG